MKKTHGHDSGSASTASPRFDPPEGTGPLSGGAAAPATAPSGKVQWRAVQPGEMGGFTLLIGPPPASSPVRALFDDYRVIADAKTSGEGEAPADTSAARLWEQHERQLLGALFGPGPAGEPAAVGRLLSTALRSEVHIAEYTPGFTRIKGEWVTTLTIDYHQVRSPHDQVLLWPPPSDAVEAVAALVGRVLEREWVRTLVFGEALCPTLSRPRGRRKRPAVELPPHAFFDALVRERNLLPALEQAIRIDQERLDALAESGKITALEEVFQNPDEHYILFEDGPSAPDADVIVELLGGTASTLATFFYESGGPMCSTSSIFLARDACGHDLLFARDEWTGYPLIAIRRSDGGTDDELRALLFRYLIESDAAGFPPSSIENHRPDLIRREDFAVALYQRLERTDGWSDFQEQLELDLRYPVLKPPEVLFSRAIGALAESTGADAGEPEPAPRDRREHDTASERGDKAHLVALYLSRPTWYRE